jgi:serine/threonine protein kinase
VYTITIQFDNKYIEFYDNLSMIMSGSTYLCFRQDWRLGTDFEIGKPLGEGKFGHVYLARTRSDKMTVALKVIHSKQIEEDRMEHQINRETEIHSDLE